MTLIPDLERDLVDAARRRPRRRRARAAMGAGALALAVATVAIAVPALTGNEDTGPSGPAGSRAEPTLQELLGVFRRPQTPRDRTGTSIEELEATGDRQPGEDTTRSRRVDLEAGPVYLWPMRDGVCASWGNCLGLDSLEQLGVALSVESGSGPEGLTRLAVGGIVVDGIDEVAFDVPGMDPIVLQVKRNVFRSELSTTGPVPTRATWTYRGKRRSQPLPAVGEPAPPPNSPPRPVRSTLSPQVRFAFGGVRYTAVGFRAHNDSICTRLWTRVPNSGSTGCASERLIRQGLREGPYRVVGGGGARHSSYFGFARADTTNLTVVGSRRESRVILSPRWSPKPWRGRPIRFIYVLVKGRPPGPRAPLPRLEMR